MITLTNVRNADVGDGVIGVTIVNDDAWGYPMPDLVVSAVSAPETASPGEVVTVSFTVTNRGTATAVGFGFTACKWVDRVSMTGSFQVLQPCGSDPLEPGSSYTRTVNMTIPQWVAETRGRWAFLMIKTDAMTTVYESDEDNNTRSVTIVIVR